jgi:hypothetical protein
MRLARNVLVIGLALTIVLSVVGAGQRSFATPVQADSSAPGPGPNRKTTITVNVTLYEWWLLFWNNNERVCKLFIEHTGLPTSEDIGLQCGSSIQTIWNNTPPCTVESSALSAQCPGLYLHLVGNYTIQRDVSIDLPPPQAYVQVTGCNPVPPQNVCDQLPQLLISGEEPLPNETILNIQGTINGETFMCSGSTCTLPLQPTGPQGIEVDFWANSSFGDSTDHYSALVRVVPYGDFMAPEGRTDNTEKWYVDVISSQWIGAPLASCSEEWQSFPELGGPPVWLTTPQDASALTSDTPYYLLAGVLIQEKVVDTSSCPDGGLTSPGVASACGLEAARGQVNDWQNQFNQEILTVARDTDVPAQLIKRIFSRESQFWPGMFTTYKEVGLGQMTENGADTLLLWNYSFYSQFCPLVFNASTCQKSFTQLTTDQQATLRGALVSHLNATCEGCESGIDLTRADYSVRVFARTLLANCAQVGGIVSAATRQYPGQVSSFSDLWRFTLVNYNAGSGCLTDAVNGTLQARQPLDWAHLATHLASNCQGAIQYVQDITGESPPENSSTTPTPTPGS